MTQQITSITEFLKSGLSLQELYKLTANSLGKTTTKHRAENLKKHRQQVRDKMMYEKRNISQSQVEPDCSKLNATKSMLQQKAEERLARLRQWQVIKNQKKIEEQKKQKPIFKVFHVVANALPNIETANKIIKGKLIPKTKAISASSDTFSKPVKQNAPPSNSTNPTKSSTNRYGTRSTTIKPSAASNVKPSTSTKAKDKTVKTTKITKDIVQTKQPITKTKPANVKQKSNRRLSGDNFKEGPVQTVTKAKFTEVTSALKNGRKRRLSKADNNIEVNKIDESNSEDSSGDTTEQKTVAQPKLTKLTPHLKSKRKKRWSVEQHKILKNITEEAEFNQDDGFRSDDTSKETAMSDLKSTSKRRSSRVQNKTPSKRIQEAGLLSDSKNTPVSDLSSKNIQQLSEKKKTPSRKIEESQPDDDSNKTPLTEHIPESTIYISPFVTVSRGKDRARREYNSRQSGTIEEIKEIKSDIVENTSNKAAAAHFTQIVENEISKLEKLCDEWNTYKDEETRPEGVCDMINVAVGQSQLLITKKIKQFQGLIDRCAMGGDDHPVTPQDLHGFWDMVYMQVTNLNKRFENLETLKMNNWEEILPVRPNNRKPQAIKKPKAKCSSALRDAIKAARNKKSAQESSEVNTLKAGFSSVTSPIRNRRISERTPRRSRSSLMPHLDSERNTPHHSPGLKMMRVTQAERIEQAASVSRTPAKSILKTTPTFSSKKKSVNFRRSILDKENSQNSANTESRDDYVDTPRRSARLKSQRIL